MIAVDSKHMATTPTSSPATSVDFEKRSRQPEVKKIRRSIGTASYESLGTVLLTDCPN